VYAAQSYTEIALQPLAGVGISGVILQVLLFPDQEYLQFVYDGESTPIHRKDIPSCHRGSVMHFIERMLEPKTLPEAVKDWGPAVQLVQSDTEGETSETMLRRNSTMLMSVLVVLGVIGIVFGLFWGRYRLNNSREFVPSGVAPGATLRLVGEEYTRVKNTPKNVEVVPLTEPKVRCISPFVSKCVSVPCNIMFSLLFRTIVDMIRHTSL
jgi:hypothetical protein